MNSARNFLLLLPVLFTAALMSAQQIVNVAIDAAKPEGRFEPVWAWVGHDEPNNTYSEEGQSLLTRLSQLSSYPVHDRTHNLLTSGDGTASLKWGSTNVFSRDASGKPVYDWTILDKIFDTYKQTGVIAFVEIGFMPEALSIHPQPYRHHWPQSFGTGWSYPPKNYDEWSDLIYAWVRHMVQRYGAQEVSKWQWEVWNEPDIIYWHGTFDDYCKLYDYTAAAVKRALPAARIGGPATTGPANPKAADFLRHFLQHTIDGRNYATGRKGAPLDFISFHAKGKAHLVDGHADLNIETNLRDIDRGFAIIEKFPTLRHLPVVLSESDPESCAACDAASHPENQYRLSSQYAAYEAELLHGTLALAERHHINLGGSVSWAFTFPNQPLFAGLRALSTRSIDLPVMNLFRMLGQMRGNRLAAESDAAVPLDNLVASARGDSPDINAMATGNGHSISVLVWNYSDDSTPAPAAEIRLNVKGLPHGVSHALLEHWRIDNDHSNPYAAWQAMGAPPQPTDAQYQKLKAAGQLQLLESPRWISVNNGAVDLAFTEPRLGVSLLNLTW